MTHSPTAPAGSGDDRPLWPAILRGWRGRCPACGEGRILYRYLKVQDACPACGEPLFHHRADDGPAYLTILVTGHLMAPILSAAFLLWRPDPVLLAVTMAALTIVLALWLLPRLKGALIAIQWSRRMHGFGAGPDPAAPGSTDGAP